MGEIKVTGTPVTYGEGATRNTKEGKGRFDLIPPTPFIYLEMIFRGAISMDMLAEEPTTACAYSKIMNHSDDPTILAQAMVEIMMIRERSWTLDEFVEGDCWADTMKKLAIHFENGAKIYGERNCEKGIPAWSFKDSCLRHFSQWINREDDEDHYIATIWNLWMLIWTVAKPKENVNPGVKTDVSEVDIVEILKNIFGGASDKKE